MFEEEVHPKDLELDVNNKPFQLQVEGGGHIEGMATLQSKWSDYAESRDAIIGMLNRKGNITLINPDEKSPIGNIDIQIDESIYYQHGRSRIEYSKVKVLAFPRNPDTLSFDTDTKKPTGEFLNKLQESVPSGAWEQTPNVLLNNHGFCGNDDFVKKHQGHSNPNGGLLVTVIDDRKISNSQDKALDELVNSESLSSDPNTRKAIVSCIKGLFFSNKLIEQPTSSIAEDKPKLSGGGSSHPRINKSPGTPFPGF